MFELRHLDTRTMEFVQDARFPEISIKLLESRATHPTISVMIARVAVGGDIPRHTHPVETETAYVLSGQGKLITDTADYTFDAGIALSIPPGLAHRVVNTGDIPLEIFAIHSPATR